ERGTLESRPFLVGEVHLRCHQRLLGFASRYRTPGGGNLNESAGRDAEASRPARSHGAAGRQGPAQTSRVDMSKLLPAPLLTNAIQPLEPIGNVELMFMCRSFVIEMTPPPTGSVPPGQKTCSRSSVNGDTLLVWPSTSWYPKGSWP